MNAKFFGNSLFGGEFFVKDFPLSDEIPDPNILKLSFQGIGNNLVITGRTHDGRTLTVFGVSDTTSVTFNVTNENGSYTDENENLTWEWEDNVLNVYVSTYGFLKAIIYDNYDKEVVYPVKIEKYEVVETHEEIIVDKETGDEITVLKEKTVEKEKILVVFPLPLTENEQYTIKLMYSYNGLDVSSSLGDASMRNIGISSGNIPVIETNGTLNWRIIPFASNAFEIKKPETNQFIDLNNGNFQIVSINEDINFNLNKNSNFRNGDKLTLQVRNNGSKIFVNGVEIDCFYGLYNLTIVKINYVYQYWGKQEIKEIR